MKNSFENGVKKFAEKNYDDALKHFLLAEMNDRTLLAISYCYYRLEKIVKCVEYLKKSIGYKNSEKAQVLKIKLLKIYEINFDRWETYVKCVACSGRGERFTGGYDGFYPAEVERGCFVCHGVGRVDPDKIQELMRKDDEN